MAGQSKESSEVWINLSGLDPKSSGIEQRLTWRSPGSLSSCLETAVSTSRTTAIKETRE
jgi:hypothetical protein